MRRTAVITHIYVAVLTLLALSSIGYAVAHSAFPSAEKFALLAAFVVLAILAIVVLVFLIMTFMSRRHSRK